MDTKLFYKSKGILGPIGCLVAPLMIWLFSDVTVDNQTLYISKVLMVVFTAFMWLCGLIAIYGRIKADKKIGL